METQQLGKTPHRTTPLGLGLAALGRPGYINLGHSQDLQGSRSVDNLQQRAHEVLDAAWMAGIRYFDAARSYGKSEQFLSNWLTSRKIDPSSVTIGSKWGYTYTADWEVQLPAGDKHEVKDHTLPVLDRQVEESKTLLGKFLNVYQIHSATFESQVFENGSVLDRLGQLRETGLTLGFSVSGPQQAEVIRRGVAIEHQGKPLFGTVQATWNLLEPSAGKALAEAHAAGFGVIVKEAVANGRLTERNDSSVFSSRRKRLERIVAGESMTIDAVALACVLKQPWVDVVLSGAASCEHLAANVRAVALSQSAEFTLCEDEKAMREFAETPADYWQIRSDLAWN